MKSVGIRSYSGPYFPAFGLNADQNNSKYGHFLRSDCLNNGKEEENLKKHSEDSYYQYVK